MSVSAGSVKVQLDAGSSKFTIAMSKAADAVNGIGKSAAGAIGKLDALGTAIEKAQEAAGKTGFGAIKDLGGGIAKYAGAAAVALTGIGVYAAKSAEDLAEIGDEIQRTFGDRAPMVQAFADSLARDLGVSAVDARKAMVDLGNQLTFALGDTGAAEEQSRAMVQLAADLAAAKNVSFEEAMGAVSAGLRGATRGLAQYGIFLSEDAVKQKALEMGVAGATDKLSEQQEVVVRLALAMQQGSKYAGEAAKDTGTLAGQTNLAMEALRALGRDVGSVLLPPLIEVAKRVAAAARWFADLSPRTKEWIAYGLAAAAAAATLAAALGGLLVVVGQVGTGVTILKAVLPALGGALSSVGAVIGSVLLAIGVFIGAFTLASKVMEAFGFSNTGASGAVKALDSVIESLGGSALDVARMLISVFSTLAAVILFPFTQLPIVGEKISAALEWATSAVDEYLFSLEDTSTATADLTGESTETAEALAALTKTGATDFVKLFAGVQGTATTAAAALTKEIERQVKAMDAFEEASSKINADFLAATTSPIEQLVAGSDASAGDLRKSAATAGLDESALHDLVQKIDRVLIKGLADHVESLGVGTVEFMDAMDDATEVVDAMGYSASDLYAANEKLRQGVDDLGTGVNTFANVEGEATVAVREFIKELNAPAAGIEQAAGGIASGMLGGDSLGGAVEGAMGAAGMGPIGALVGGAITSFTEVLQAGAQNVSSAFDTLVGTMFRESGKIGEAFFDAVVGMVVPLAAGFAAVVAMLVLPLLVLAAVVGSVALPFVALLLPAIVVLAPALLILAGATVLAAAPMLLLAAGAVALVGAFAAWSVLALTLATAATQTEAYARTTERIGAEFNRLAAALEPLIEKLGVGMVNVVARTVDVMLPFATALANSDAALVLLFNTVKLAALGFGFLLLVAGYLQNALLDLAAMFLDVLAALNPNRAQAARQRAAADSLQLLKVNTDDLAAALAALNAASLTAGRGGGDKPPWANIGAIDIPLDRFGNAADDATESLREMTNSATNVPTGFKVAVSRFRALAADDFGAAPAGTTIATSTGGTGAVTIEYVEVKASSLSEIVDQVQEAAERASFRNTGTTRSRDELRR